jgi:hypothetical protein
MSNSIKDSAQAFAVNQVLKYVDSNPQEAFPKLLDWADKFDKDNLYLTQRQQIRKVMEQPDSNWMRLINSLWTDIDSEVRKVFFRNFIVNASLLGSRKQVANREKYGCNIPWAILMDPTSACNLHCTGCWAAEYGNKLNLSYEELDDIINQANELGICRHLQSAFTIIFTHTDPFFEEMCMAVGDVLGLLRKDSPLPALTLPDLPPFQSSRHQSLQLATRRRTPCFLPLQLCCTLLH